MCVCVKIELFCKFSWSKNVMILIHNNLKCQILYLSLQEKSTTEFFVTARFTKSWQPHKQELIHYIDVIMICSLAISPDGLLCQCREQRAWEGCRSTHGVSGGDGISLLYTCIRAHTRTHTHTYAQY